MLQVTGVRRAVRISVVLILSILGSSAYAGTNSASDTGVLRAYLQKHVGWGPVLDKAMRYTSARVSLDGKMSHQIFVYLTGPGWCGSGGCTALLLRPTDGSFKVIDRFTLVRLPVVVLPSKTNGWHDLAMPVAGGGIINEYTALLRFNGHKYPSNPSMAPKLPSNLAGKGMKIPLSEHGNLVY